MTEPILVVDTLSFRYPDGRAALSELSFQLAAGETVGLVGPNGAGKSTLLLHLNGVLGADQRLRPADDKTASANPAIRVAGLPVVTEHLPVVRRKVGLLFQDPDDQLFCPTVLEDVAFGPLQQGLSSTECRRIAGESLAAVGLTNFENRIPHHLSFGERKRVCLAGVLACRPEILALDEPTSNLDPRGRRQLIELLRSLPMAKLIATHDLELTLELCSRVLVLDGGRLHADGPARAVLSQEDLLLRHGLEVPLSIRLA